MGLLHRTLSEIRAGGWPVLLRKGRKALLFALLLPLCLPLVLAIRLIRPFKVIRFTWVPYKLFGHAVFEPEVYLSQQALGLLPEPGTIDLYYFEEGQPANRYWKKMVERHLPVSRFYSYLARFNKLVPGWEKHYRKPYAERYATADPDNLLGRVGLQIRFTEEEEAAGVAFLRRMGIPVGGKFVCVQVRDSAHDIQYNPAEITSTYCEYRNSNIENYKQVFEYLSKQGYWVLRMGKVTAHPLRVSNPMIIDYSNSGERTELLDIWLCFNCTFMISTGSGIDAVAAIARKPIVCVDFLAYMDTTYFFRNSLIIFKHLYERQSGRKLSLSEIIELESQSYYKNSEFYWSRGVEWRSNTPQEIEDAVKEMDARLNACWHEMPGDTRLQSEAGRIISGAKQYQSVYGDQFVHRIGAQFLRDDPAWLA